MRLPRRPSGRRSLRRALVVAVSVVLSASLVGPVSAETYAPTGMLGGVAGIYWDPANDRVYTTNWASAAVNVWELDGTPVASIALAERGWGLAKSGGDLFVALIDYPQSIAKVDIATQTVTGYLSTPSVSANSIAVAGGRVWFNESGVMASVDVDDDTQIVEYPWDGATYPGSPRFAQVPGDPDAFLAWGNSAQGPTVYLYDTSGGSLDLVDTYDAGLIGLEHLVVAPDGGRFYYSYYKNPGITGIGEVRLSDLTKVDDYAVAGSRSIQAIAVSPSGGHVAFSEEAAPSRIWVFPHGAATPVRTITIGTTCSGAFTALDGMAFGPGATTLATIQQLEQEQFVSYDNPTTATATSSITLGIVPSGAVPGDPYTVQGDLTLSSGSVSGRSVKIWTTGADGIELDRTITTAVDGSFQFAGTASLDTPCYTARFEGTSTITGSSALAVMTVDRLTTSISIDAVTPSNVAPTETVTISGTVSVEAGEDQTGRALTLRRYHYETGRTVDMPFQAGAGGAFAATDQPPLEGRVKYYVIAPATTRWAEASTDTPTVDVERRNPKAKLAVSDGDIEYGRSVVVNFSIPEDATERHVRITEQKTGSATRKVVFDGEVDAAGKVSVTRSPTQTVTYRAVFTGDPRYADATVEREVGVHPIVVAKLLKASGSSGRYKLYRPTQTVYFATAVSPDQTGRQITIDLERYARGRWRGWATDTFKLREGSGVIVYIRPGVLKPGVRYRMRSLYSHLPAYTTGRSPYQYFRLT